MISLASLWLVDHSPVSNQIASKTKDLKRPDMDLEDLGLAELESEFLADPPPVISLGVISEHQFVTLNCLEALAEEAE